MSCLMCRYYRASEPVEHQRVREAGKCEHSCGNKWDRHAAIQYVRRHRKYLQGFCLHDPQPVPHNCADVCGQISTMDWLIAHWGIEPFKAEDNLHDWAAEQMQTLLDGSWRDQRAEKLENDVKRLRAELKASKKLSASRLERLRKPKPATEPKPKQSPALRIVA